MTRFLRFFRPSHQHTAFSATLLLMGTVMLSRVIGYIREAYIAYAFGAGPQTDAYVAAFTLPDWLNYIVAGGAASITFISIYTRFLAEKRDADAKKTFSVIITVMTVVMVVGEGTDDTGAQFVRLRMGQFQRRHLFQMVVQQPGMINQRLQNQRLAAGDGAALAAHDRAGRKLRAHRLIRPTVDGLAAGRRLRAAPRLDSARSARRKRVARRKPAA